MERLRWFLYRVGGLAMRRKHERAVDESCASTSRKRPSGIGICLALGAPVARVVRTELTWMLVMVIAGTGLGMLVGLRSERLLDALLFGVTGTDAVALAGPLAMVCSIAAIASVPPILRGIRTDITATIRSQ